MAIVGYWRNGVFLNNEVRIGKRLVTLTDEFKVEETRMFSPEKTQLGGGEGGG